MIGGQEIRVDAEVTVGITATVWFTLGLPNNSAVFMIKQPKSMSSRKILTAVKQINYVPMMPDYWDAR